MKLWRIIPFLVLVGILGTAVWGAATALDLTRNQLTAGFAKVERCDNEFQIFWNADYNQNDKEMVTRAVTVAGINDSCANKTIRIAVVDKAGQLVNLIKGNTGDAPVSNFRTEFVKCDPFVAKSNCQSPADEVNGVHVVIQDK